MAKTLTYTVRAMNCAHCEAAISAELQSVPSVTRVDTDLETKLVVVEGDGLDDASLRAAIVDAGYEAAR